MAKIGIQKLTALQSQKMFFQAALISILFLVVCCSPPQVVEPDRLRTHLGFEPATVNPLFATDGYTMAVATYIFESLLRRDVKTGELVPALAESFEILPDRKTYRFHLRQNVFWQNGEKFTADDVVATVGVLQNEQINPQWQAAARQIARVEKRDAFTVDFVYADVYYQALTTCASLPILPQAALKAAAGHLSDLFRHDAVGTGPFVLQHWFPGSRVVLQRNENYWGVKPGIRHLEIRFIPDATLAFQMLKKGELDLLDDAREIQWVRQTDGEKFNRRFAKKSFLAGTYSYIGWNNAHPLFADARVRQAMTEILNRELILQKLKYGLGVQVTGPFHPDSPEYNKAVAPLPYDPEHALALLRAAGWSDRDGDGILDKDGQSFAFTLLINNAPFVERLSTIYQEDLRRIGIEMKLQKLEDATLIGRALKKDFDAIVLLWGFGYDSDLSTIWHSGRSYNFVSYQNPRVDAILATLQSEFAPDERRRLNHEMHALIYADQPYTFLFADRALLFVAKRFHNVNIYPRGYDLLEWRVE